MAMKAVFGSRTKMKAALAVAGALAIAGAIGSAVAFSPIITPPLKWQGGAEFRVVSGSDTFVTAYVVPAGRNFLLTDLVVANFSSTRQFFHISAGPGGICEVGSPRLEGVIVRGDDNTVLAFQTGIGFAAGQAVCIQRSVSNMNFNGRGFLFTPAPAS